MASPSTSFLGVVFLATCLVGLSQSQQPFGKPCEGYPQSEIYCYGDFLFTVQRAKFYPDQKVFVDRPLKYPASEVLTKFAALNISGENLSSPEKSVLFDFINENFHPNGTEFEPWDPTDWDPNPAFLSRIADPLLRQWASELHSFWKELGRKINSDVRDNADLNSMYYVSHPVIVPGGRFKEFYYWDSYWIQRGLLISNMTETVKGMILNFFEMVETLGFIPNGGRIYYQRSQPPLLLPMVDGYYEHTQDLQFLKDNIRTMIKEFDFFINKRTVSFTHNDKPYRMARYNVELTEPRPESFSEDYELVDSLPVTREEEELLYANLKTGAESGWDFSSRWYVVPEGESLIDGNLTHTKTRDIIPVDLNSFMYWNAALLEKFCGLINDRSVCDPVVYGVYKEAFKTSIREVLWDEELGAWFDYDFVRGKKRKYFYPTNITPLWVGAQHGTIEAMTKRVVNYLQASGATNFPGGVPTSMLQTGLQWDFPNSRLFRLEATMDRMDARRRIMKVPIPRLKDRSNPMEDLDEVGFLRRFHLRKTTVHYIFGVIADDIKRPNDRGCPVPPLLELCIALRFFATDAFQIVVADLYSVNQSTVSRIVVHISNAIAKRAKDFIKFPSFNDAADFKSAFYEIAGFPGVVGCIDGTHIPIQSPGGPNAELFRNRKGTYSLNVQAICDARLVFTDIVIRWYGSCHDSRIFDNSVIKDKLENNEVPGILLGDGGYACTHFLMTPLLNPQTTKEKRYNKAQIKTRNCVERSFGVWKRRFPCLKMLRVKLNNALVVVTAVAVLHNICRRRHDLFEDDEFDSPDMPPTNNVPQTATLSGRAAREQIIASHF